MRGIIFFFRLGPLWWDLHSPHIFEILNSLRQHLRTITFFGSGQINLFGQKIPIKTDYLEGNNLCQSPQSTLEGDFFTLKSPCAQDLDGIFCSLNSIVFLWILIVKRPNHTLQCPDTSRGSCVSRYIPIPPFMRSQSPNCQLSLALCSTAYLRGRSLGL